MAFLLLQNGGFLLLQSGGKLLLQGGTVVPPIPPIPPIPPTPPTPVQQTTYGGQPLDKTGPRIQTKREKALREEFRKQAERDDQELIEFTIVMSQII